MNSDPAASTSSEPPHGEVIRTIISDDERLAREKLRILLASEPNIQLVAECQDGQQTLSALRTFRADLLLLDIQMPGMDGFQVLNDPHPRGCPSAIFPPPSDNKRF